jgi:magnesium transporter
MKTPSAIDALNDPVLLHAKKDFVAVGVHKTVQEALDSIRTSTGGGSYVYFYVLDSDSRVVGVIQTRRLLTAPLDCLVDSIMTRKVIAIPESASLLEACEFFVMHRLMAFPVVDREGRLVAVIDIGIFAKEMLQIEEQEQVHTVFDTIGVRLAEARSPSAWSVFRYRFPWLLATIASGTACALLVGLFEVTLTRSLILAFFMTLVLGLAESVSMQTMAVTVHALHHQSFRPGWYSRSLRRELARTILLGLACGAIVAGVAVFWKGDVSSGLVIGSGILASLLMSCFLGISVPTLLHRLKLDLRVASGPVTLAMTDVCTIVAYFSLAAAVLGK